MSNSSTDAIKTLWRNRTHLQALLKQHGALALGAALAKHFGLQDSRNDTHKLAALLMAMTDFTENYDYLDFYGARDIRNKTANNCLQELQKLRFSHGLQSKND